MSTAYGILSDADKRARYDKEGFGGLEKKDLEVLRTAFQFPVSLESPQQKDIPNDRANCETPDTKTIKFVGCRAIHSADQ